MLSQNTPLRFPTCGRRHRGGHTDRGLSVCEVPHHPALRMETPVLLPALPLTHGAGPALGYHSYLLLSFPILKSGTINTFSKLYYSCINFIDEQYRTSGGMRTLVNEATQNWSSRQVEIHPSVALEFKKHLLKPGCNFMSLCSALFAFALYCAWRALDDKDTIIIIYSCMCVPARRLRCLSVGINYRETAKGNVAFH